MRLQEYDTSEASELRVEASQLLTPAEAAEEVRELTLDVAAKNFDPLPGQSIGVLAPARFGEEHHFRLYSVADLPERTADGVRIRICVRRCSYIDQYSGEQYRGVASNYLCDLGPGDTLTVTGPYDAPFDLPEEDDPLLILIGAGTGIAPFRAFVRRLYEQVPDFAGRVWLLHGARTGLELLYMNEQRNDFAQYYQQETFEAISALSSRPHWSDAIDWEDALRSRGEELWGMLLDHKTYVYVAGLESVSEQLDQVFVEMAGSKKKWDRRKAELKAGGRWRELLY